MMREPNRKHRLLFWWGALLIALIIVAFSYERLGEIFSIEGLRSYSSQIRSFIDEHYALSLLLYTVIYVVDNICALPLASGLTVAAGYFYGAWIAFFATLLALTIGATAAFYLSRYFIGSYIHQKYGVRLRRFNQLCDQYGTYFLLAVRLTIFIPFVLVNVLAGLTVIPIKKFVWTTFVGMIPATLFFAFSGAQFYQLQSIGDLFTWKVMALFSLLLCILLLPLVLNRRGLGF